MSEINDVLTLAEAAERWGVPVRTLQCAATGQKGLPPRFRRDETRQSGRTWLVTRRGMQRLYGIPKK